ncbi:cyclohexanone monooxygenase [Lophiostoma macrostomum CBS 122681]|uniref:Cyclohexanone monooxygenase n=1 Tax=Lophiostoma macrostomum CBS 122681 TaxID=1314788 RepID=A0A6A6SYS7_9PLEO|nr:cyclohexanone monooxygenase [Lophiostoma macrostomum CBS 122681]
MGSIDIDEVPVQVPSSFGSADTLKELADKCGWPRENERGYKIDEELFGHERPIRVIHIGAGISGICLAKFLPEKLNNATLVCYDKNNDIGGTWLENRYPGCGCDIPSVNYQYTWARNPNWTHFYSYAAEIWQYLRDVVDQYELEKYMKLNHEITQASWDETAGVWNVTVKNLLTGDVFVDTAEILINGSGVLNNWKWPNIDGLRDFEGTICHTARFDTSVDLRGKRVAVIGMGSSGIQVTAEISQYVEHMYTWIRSPTWITAGFAQNHAGPDGTNFEYSSKQKQSFAQDPTSYLEYCKEIESELNQRFKFILNGTPESAQAIEFSTQQMTKRLNGRVDLAERIIPTTFNVGCRRPTPGNGFLEALIRPNVTTFTQGIKKITPKGVLNEDGTEVEVDVIICATGFDTSWVPRIPIIANGRNAQDILRDRPISYLSVALPEIPNYWTAVGPYGPLGHGSFVPLIEHVTKYILTAAKKMQVENIKSLTPKLDVCDAFAEHADLFLKRTAWSGECRSWFKQGRLDGKLSIFPGSRLVFFGLMERPRYEDYRIQYRNGDNPFSFLGNGFSTKEFDGSDLAYYLGSEENPGGMLKGRKKQIGSTTNGYHVM